MRGQALEYMLYGCLLSLPLLSTFLMQAKQCFDELSLLKGQPFQVNMIY